jgi:DNA polymerase-3 subunit delta'
MFVEPDGAQIKIEQARDVLQFLSLRNLGRARIILIDPAHAMGPQAANALLKALEEPPPGTYFILVTSQAAALLPTIRSRSQLVRFKPLSTAELSRVLTAQGITSPDPWTVSNAHGSVEMASRLSESRESYVELEDLVARYLATAPARFPNEEISALRERMKDRSSQNFVATLLQSLMSDTLRAQAGVNVERDSQWVDLVQGLAKFKPEAIRILSERSIEFEHDLARNVDRGLLLENFALIVKQGSQGGLG